MRLIDADAVLDSFEECPNLVGPHAVDILDAAPTVSCEECRYGPNGGNHIDEFCRDECRCGSEFERTQPCLPADVVSSLRDKAEDELHELGHQTGTHDNPGRLPSAF